KTPSVPQQPSSTLPPPSLSSDASLVTLEIQDGLLGFALVVRQPAMAPHIDPIVKARDYVFSHFPKRYSAKGAYLSYYVSDHRDAWLVEVSNQDELGGGVRLLVVKRSGATTLVGFSQ
ncbi:hypothetical protein, partial [Sphingomonas psychrolutea]|uniref:hypothetical protein n=1 Tax=Sphingomonas psychrolutea TaxID=1259676 RepID=UPI001E2F2D76